tara:strand:+ start:153 stop:422 length:270 start_codon:yes stop_codon:yes gene_type:complete
MLHVIWPLLGVCERLADALPADACAAVQQVRHERIVFEPTGRFGSVPTWFDVVEKAFRNHLTEARARVLASRSLKVLLSFAQVLILCVL